MTLERLDQAVEEVDERGDTVAGEHLRHADTRADWRRCIRRRLTGSAAIGRGQGGAGVLHCAVSAQYRRPLRIITANRAAGGIDEPPPLLEVEEQFYSVPY